MSGRYRTLFTISLILIALLFSSIPAFSADTLQVLGKITSKKINDHMAIAPYHSTAYSISALNRSLTIFDLNTYRIKKEMTLGRTPLGIAVDPGTGYAWIIARSLTDPNNKTSLSVIDTTGFTIRSSDIPPTVSGIVIDPVRKTALLSFGSEKKLRFISTETYATVREIALPYAPDLMGLDTVSNTLIFTVSETSTRTRLIALDIATGAVTQNLVFAEPVVSVAVDSGMHLAVVVTPRTVSVIDTTAGAMKATITTPSPKGIKDPLASFTLGVAVNPSTHTAVIIIQI